jgi:hypothetical protein
VADIPKSLDLTSALALVAETAARVTFVSRIELLHEARRASVEGPRKLADRPLRQRGVRATAALLLCLTVCPAYAQRAVESPFAGLAGSWSGGGTISLANGTTERIRCRATYATSPSGTDLQQTLRCASDSHNFDLRSNVSYAEGRIRGTWTEHSRNASGTVSGQAERGVIQANVIGPNFSAGLSVSTRGDRQAVTISSQGSPLAQASISLVRGSR